MVDADRLDRLRHDQHRGRGAARRAELHQAVPPAVQHPAARRQELPVHRDLDGRGLPARLLHPRAPPPRPRLLRPVLQRQARPRHARPARQGVPVPHLPGRGAGPAQRLAVPGLLHQALRGPVRRLRRRGGLHGVDRRRRRVPVRPLPRDRARPRGEDEGRGGRAGVRAGGRSNATACGPCARCSNASGSPTRASARSTRSPSRSTGSTPTPRCSRYATASSATASRFYLENQAERELGEVAEEFLLQYYGAALSIPPQVIVQAELPDPETMAAVLGERRGAAVEVRHAQRGDKRRILELADAQREAGARPGASEDRAPSPAARAGARRPPGGRSVSTSLPIRIECFDISNLMGTHTVASMVVFEGGAPKKSDYRRFNVRGTTDGVPDDFAAMEEVLGRRLAQWETQQDLSPARPQAQRVVRDAAEPDRHRRRPGPARRPGCGR